MTLADPLTDDHDELTHGGCCPACADTLDRLDELLTSLAPLVEKLEPLAAQAGPLADALAKGGVGALLGLLRKS